MLRDEVIIVQNLWFTFDRKINAIFKVKKNKTKVVTSKVLLTSLDIAE